MQRLVEVASACQHNQKRREWVMKHAHLWSWERNCCCGEMEWLGRRSWSCEDGECPQRCRTAPSPAAAPPHRSQHHLHQMIPASTSAAAPSIYTVDNICWLIEVVYLALTRRLFNECCTLISFCLLLWGFAVALAFHSCCNYSELFTDALMWINLTYSLK